MEYESDNEASVANELSLDSQKKQDMEKELKSTLQKLRRSEKHFEELRIQHGKLLHDYKKQDAEVKGLVSFLSNAEIHRQEMDIKLAISQQQLQACKDDLFRMQPQAQIPDMDISKGFDAICQCIIGWVETEISIFEKAHPTISTEDLFSAAGDSNVFLMLQEFPESGEYLIRYEIHQCLQETMFGKEIFLLGLPEKTAAILQQAERSMKGMEPHRGTS